LLALTSRLSEPLTADDVARVVVDRAQAAVGAVTAIMWAVDDPPTYATMVRAVGEDPGLASDQRIRIEASHPMGDAILRREPLFFESRACLPLVVHGRVIGCISLLFGGMRAFDDEERMLLTVLAHHAAQALDRAHLLEREKAARQRLASLQQLTSALSSAATTEAVATLAARVGAEALGLVGAGLWAADDQGDLFLLGEYGMNDELRKIFRRIPIDSALPAARIARKRRALWCESEADLDTEDPSITAALGRGDAFQAYVALPLIRDDRVLGVLAFSAGRPRHFTPEERAFISTVAEHCADAIARARLYDDARRMELRLQSVLERLPVGVFVSRPPDSTLVFMNDAYARIWRADSLPVKGADRCKVLKVSYPDGRPMAISDSPVTRALKGETVDRMEARIERHDGTQGWIEVSAAPILRADGSVEVAVCTAVDISAEKDARAEADAAGRAKDEFLAMLGHELRNPLSPIVTALHLMRMRGGNVLERERAVIDRQVHHLMRLVDDLLDVSRATRGALRLERKPIELAAIVGDAVEVAGPLIEERHQSLSVSVPQTGLVIDADRGRLAQVITNLLNNAAKYTPPAGRIEVSARVDGDEIALDVADNGAGIPEELLPRVFDAFTQGRQGLDRKQGGLGLGLAIARQLIAGHEGTIEAKSAKPGGGTVMIVRLPRSSLPSSRHQTSHDDAAAEPRRAGRRVLIVDDNPDAVALLAEALTEAGHEVRTVGDGPSALALVESFVPEIAFLDIGLPVMDGYELAGLLRQIPSLAHVPLVALTGYAQEGDRQRALANGFVDHLTKPLRTEDVLSRIDQLLGDPPTQ
jgi:signal transduction histidine kinase/ActR/RegA family two-component response regulator